MMWPACILALRFLFVVVWNVCILLVRFFFFRKRSVAYFGVYEFLKEAFAREDGTVSSAGILSAGGFAGEL